MKVEDRTIEIQQRAALTQQIIILEAEKGTIESKIANLRKTRAEIDILIQKRHDETKNKTAVS